MTEYTIRMFGLNAKGQSSWLILLVPIGLIIGYLAGCLVLYSFAELTGMIKFSWIGGVYTIVLIATLKCIFGQVDV